MAEYIEREALCKILENWRNAHADVDDEQGCGLLEDVICEVDAQTAADVAPVVHGQWIIGVDNDDFDVKCSKCEWTDIFEVAGIAAVERIAKAMHYCPNCGARMDGGVE